MSADQRTQTDAQTLTQTFTKAYPQTETRTKYSTEGSIVAMDPPLEEHALDMYIERLPADAVRPPVAWERGEWIEDPHVADTLNPETPSASRVRVYNHDGEYLVVFICLDEDGFDEGVATVYSGETHQHAPTRAYLWAHGPHYRSEERGSE